MNDSLVEVHPTPRLPKADTPLWKKRGELLFSTIKYKQD